MNEKESAAERDDILFEVKALPDAFGGYTLELTGVDRYGSRQGPKGWAEDLNVHEDSLRGYARSFRKAERKGRRIIRFAERAYDNTTRRPVVVIGKRKNRFI